ncbi:MAG: N-acetylneuraminate synthase [Magnetococcales bacterium]|nr:N-acetylneuraminate synthase [Magnetococcales bacterium]
MSNRVIRTGHLKIGPGRPCFLIAEVGVNHNGDMTLARSLIDAARAAGADAVKFQTFKSEQVIAAEAPKAAYQKRSTGADESQLDMVRALELPDRAFAELQRHACDQGILFFSTPFDHHSVDLLATLEVPLFKIPSGEITNHPLLAHVARQGKPVILSTGMATLAEVDEAVRVLRQAGCEDLALLQCTSNYPADPKSANLRAIPMMAGAFGVPVGYSDHTPGLESAFAAVALGACIVEKHFTLDKALPGPDHTASITPDEMTALARGIRIVESALGDGIKAPVPEEADTRAVARRSLYLKRDLAAGQLIGEADLIALRPSGGIPPNLIQLVVGRTTKQALRQGGKVSWQDLA